MLYRNIELHNVAELLAGDGSAVVPAECLARFAERKVSAEPYAACGPEGLWFSRIPNALRLSLNPFALVNAVQATGAELRFNLRSERARIVLKCNGAPALAEVYHGSFLAGWHVVGTEPTAIAVAPPANLAALADLSARHRLPFDARLTRVVLPWRPPVRLVAIEGEFEPPRREQTPAARFLAYGSSITHGNTSMRPTGMYAHRAAQLLGADLVNLGFGGGAHLEPQLADYIASRTDWDFATLETGINMASFGAEEFARRVDYFIPTIARAHADQWIFCLGVFTCHSDLVGPPWAAEYRAIVKAKVESLNLPRLVYVDGLELLPSVSGLTADLVHPSPSGMEEIARNLVDIMRRAPGLPGGEAAR